MTMKQVSTEINKLPIGKEKPIQAVEPDQFAAQVVNQILRELRATHPAWRSAIKNEREYEHVKRNYIKAMMEQGVCTMEQVDRGLEMARKNKTDFMPGPGKFCAWCLDDGEMINAFQRMVRRRKAKTVLERFVRNDCEFTCRQLSEEKSLVLFEKTFHKFKKLQREGKLPADLQALPIRSVVTEFDKMRNERGVPNPASLSGVFKRIAELAQHKEKRI
jgi:hypothetical protein